MTMQHQMTAFLSRWSHANSTPVFVALVGSYPQFHFYYWPRLFESSPFPSPITPDKGCTWTEGRGSDRDVNGVRKFALEHE
jgi:hypothetical protein